MVLAVLAVIWVLALTPMLLRKISERRFTTSVNSFHRQLGGLRRAYPRLAATAADPQALLFASDAPSTGESEMRSGHELAVRPSAAYTSRHRPPVARAPRSTASPAARRRRVLAALAVSIVGFFALGTIPVLRVLWGLSLLAVAATASYMALLINIHRRQMERSDKVVDIRKLRGEADAVPEARSHVSRIGFSRPTVDALEWEDDEDFDSEDQFDYDELIAGSR